MGSPVEESGRLPESSIQSWSQSDPGNPTSLHNAMQLHVQVCKFLGSY